MNQTAAETLSVVVERDLPYPPEKIWRALTQPHMIAEWLMNNDFKPVVGHTSVCAWTRSRTGTASSTVRCVVGPNKTLSYAWGALELGAT